VAAQAPGFSEALIKYDRLLACRGFVAYVVTKAATG